MLGFRAVYIRKSHRLNDVRTQVKIKKKTVQRIELRVLGYDLGNFPCVESVHVSLLLSRTLQ